MMPSAIDVQGVSKQFRIIHEKPALVRALFPRWLRPVRRGICWAIRGTTFRVPAGGSLAILGPNGAGKSTLLGLIAGVLRPTQGRIDVRGRVASLLGLGIGFHPELTGEDNLWLGASLLGMRREAILQRRNDIVEFAGLDGFLDVPVGRYSAGMRLRLGFAVAIHADSDILVIDEVLTVGDLEFQRQCVERLEALRRAGKTLVFVSHDVQLVRRLSDAAMLLRHGRVVEHGPAAQVVRSYQRLSRSVVPGTAAGETRWSLGERRRFLKRLSLHNPERIAKEWGRRFHRAEAEITSVRVLDRQGREAPALTSGNPVTVEMRYRVHQPIQDPHIGIALFRQDHTYVFGPNTRFDDHHIPELTPGEGRCALAFDALPLAAGEYRWSAVLWERFQRYPYAYDCGYYPLQVHGPSPDVCGVCAVPCEWLAEGSQIVHAKRGMPDVAQRFVEQLQPRRTASAGRSDANGTGTVQLSMASDAWMRAVQWGQSVELALRITATRPLPESQCWMSIIRDPDGLLCAGWATWLDDRALSCPAGMSTLRLRIPQWPLTAGRYQIACAMWDRSGRLTQHPERVGALTVVSGRPDHGVTYLPHQWTLELPSRDV